MKTLDIDIASYHHLPIAIEDAEKPLIEFLRENEIVPFTNNLGERDIRMTKVHQKISG